MARGEDATPKRALGGVVALGGIFASTVCVLTGVVAIISQRPPQAPREPYDGMGALGIIGQLENPYAGTPAEARRNLEGMLERHGYTAVTSETPVSLQTLPLEFDVPELGGACGVLLATGEVSTLMTRIALPSGRAFTPGDPRTTTIPFCGSAHLRIEGTGRVALHPWLFAGLTEADITATGLPTEVALAHAVAAHLLRPARLEATDEVVRITPTTTGIQTLPLSRQPSTGCMPLVAIAIDADALPTQWMSGRTDEGLGFTAGAVCANRTDGLPTFDVRAGAAIYVRTYREVTSPRPAGPAMGALRIVPEASLSLTDTVPENASP